MIRQTIILLTIWAILMSCDFSAQVKETVANQLEDAKVELAADVAYAKSEFSKSVHQTLEQSKDSSLSGHVNALYASITKTSNYIDSLRATTDKLDPINPEGVELIKKEFIDKGMGDSLFDKVKYSYSLAIELAIADSTKTRLQHLKDTYTEENKKLFFEHTGPLATAIILYGMESELLKNGSMCLIGHATK